MDILAKKLSTEANSVAFAMAFCGAYVTSNLAEQFRVSKALKSKVMSPTLLLILMALSLGGVSMWVFHFVLLGSMRLVESDGSGIDQSFHAIYAGISLLVAIVFTFGGLVISSRDRAFTKSKVEIAEMVSNDARDFTIKQIKQSNNLMILALSKDLGPLAMGGVVTGAGVSCMHFIAVMSVGFQGHIIWNEGVIAASVIIAVIGSTLSFWILFRLLALYPDREIFRLCLSGILAFAISGMYYVGEAACDFVYISDAPLPVNISWIGPSEDAVYVGLAMGMSLLWVVVILILTDLRSYFYGRLSVISQIDHLVKDSMNVSSRSGGDQSGMRLFVSRYDALNLPYEGLQSHPLVKRGKSLGKIDKMNRLNKKTWRVGLRLSKWGKKGVVKGLEGKGSGNGFWSWRAEYSGSARDLPGKTLASPGRIVGQNLELNLGQMSGQNSERSLVNHAVEFLKQHNLSGVETVSPSVQEGMSPPRVLQPLYFKSGKLSNTMRKVSFGEMDSTGGVGVGGSGDRDECMIGKNEVIGVREGVWGNTREIRVGEGEGGGVGNNALPV